MFKLCDSSFCIFIFTLLDLWKLLFMDGILRGSCRMVAISTGTRFENKSCVARLCMKYVIRISVLLFSPYCFAEVIVYVLAS